MRSAFDTSYGVDSPYEIVVSLAVRSAEHQGAPVTSSCGRPDAASRPACGHGSCRLADR